jgi:hypothetical protein
MRKLLLILPAAASLYGQGGYTGPSVLSRPGAPSNHRPSTLAFRPYASLSAIYDTGLTAFSVDREGNLPDRNAKGIQASIGAYAYRYWKKNVAALQYSGDYRHYTQETYYDGSNHFLTLGVSRQHTSRLQFGFRQVAGTFSRSFGSFGGQFLTLAPSVVQSPLLVPADELFDNRTYHFSSIGDLTYQMTPRLSFALGGGGFLVRRQSSALFGVNGGTAQADTAYRVSRHSTVGISYAFVKFGFTSAFGGADLHTLGLNYSIRLGRRWEFGAMLSGIRVESQTVRQVRVDPIVAAITGISIGREAVHATNYMSGMGARLSREFRNANLMFGYTQGVSPGNGLILTSRQRTGDVTYTYTGLRRWRVGVTGRYGELSAISGQLSTYRRVEGHIGVSRSILGGDFHFIANVAMRRYETDFQNFRNRVQTRATVGISYSPGDVPLALW